MSRGGRVSNCDNKERPLVLSCFLCPVLCCVLPCALCCSLGALRAFFGSAPIPTAPNRAGPHGRCIIEFKINQFSCLFLHFQNYPVTNFFWDFLVTKTGDLPGPVLGANTRVRHSAARESPKARIPLAPYQGRGRYPAHEKGRVCLPLRGHCQGGGLAC